MKYGEKIWRDGSIVPRSEGGGTTILAHTLHYGVAAFEGIRAYRRANGETVIFRLAEHIKRLFDSCKVVMMEPRCTAEELAQGCIAVIRENGMTEGYLRPISFYDEGNMGILPQTNPVVTAVIAWEWGAYLGADGLAKGIRCKVSPYARHHVNVSFAKAKLSGQYINSVVAKRDAKLSGFDEAIMADVNGYMSEGTGENLFLVKDGVLLTPPLSGSILGGITRDTILVLAREEGIPIVERNLTRDDLYLADEVFLTGTAAEVTPVREIDFRVIGAGARGPITERLQSRFFDIARGRDDSHPEWLARVE